MDIHQFMKEFLNYLRENRKWVTYLRGCRDVEFIHHFVIYMDAFDEAISEFRVMAENEEMGMLENLVGMNTDSWTFACGRTPAQTIANNEELLVLYSKRRGYHAAHTEAKEIFTYLKGAYVEPVLR